MQYRIVDLPDSKNPTAQLQGILDNAAAGGWKYVNHQYTDKLVPGSMGCFGIGATPATTTHVGFVVLGKD